MARKQDNSPLAPARNLGQKVAQSTGKGRGAPFTSRFRRAENATSPAASPTGAKPRQVRQAQLRLVQVEPWSVMKAAFVLSVALAIVTVVAVGIVWVVLGAAGLWDSVNSIVQDATGDTNGTPFEVQKYLGTGRILGFTMIVAVADIVLVTAIATLGAFLYNLAATLVGGVEVTFAEDK